MGCEKTSCWSTIHTVHEQMNALKNNNRIKVFFAQFDNDVHNDSVAEEKDALDDLVARF